MLPCRQCSLAVTDPQVACLSEPFNVLTMQDLPTPECIPSDDKGLRGQSVLTSGHPHRRTNELLRQSSGWTLAELLR